jgi:hypothetical protein
MIATTTIVWLQPRVSCDCNFYKALTKDLLDKISKIVSRTNCTIWLSMVATKIMLLPRALSRSSHFPWTLFRHHHLVVFRHAATSPPTCPPSACGERGTHRWHVLIVVIGALTAVVVGHVPGHLVPGISIAIPQAPQLQLLKHFDCNSGHYNFY